jgi:hypothetical protein
MGIRQALINVSLDHFAIPGDVAFPLNQAFEPPRDRQDAETLRQYVPISFKSLRALSLMRFDSDTSPKYGRRSLFDYMLGYTLAVKGLPR